MSWDNVQNKHKEKYDRDIVLCTAEDERNFIISIILDEFPFLSRKSVEKAFDKCKKTFHIEDFIEHMSEEIGKV